MSISTKITPNPTSSTSEISNNLPFHFNNSQEMIQFIYKTFDIFYQIKNKKLSMQAQSRDSLILDNQSQGKLKSKVFVYLLLSVSMKEFHELFERFHKNFGSSQQDFTLKKQEFEDMLNFLCKKENIGKKKVKRYFQKIFPDIFKVSSLEDAEFGKRFGENLFESLEGGDSVRLFPILLGLYGELVENKVNMKRGSIEMIQGVDWKGEKIKSEASLREKFEEMGYRYDKETPIKLSFKDVEKVLEKFQSCFTENFGRDQLEIVMKDLKWKYKYSEKSKEFMNKPVLDRKFLTFVVFKICNYGFIHSVKNAAGIVFDRLQLLEGTVYWNAALKMEKIERGILHKKFLKYASLEIKNQDTDSVIEYDQLVSKFIQKVFPLVSSQSASYIVSRIKIDYDAKQEIILEKIGLQIYDLLIMEAETKLDNYIKMICSKMGISVVDNNEKNTGVLKISGLSKIHFESPQNKLSKTPNHSNFIDSWRKSVEDMTASCGRYRRDESNTTKHRDRERSSWISTMSASNFWSEEMAAVKTEEELINEKRLLNDLQNKGEIITKEEEEDEEFESPRFSGEKKGPGEGESFDENIFGNPFDESEAEETRKDEGLAFSTISFQEENKFQEHKNIFSVESQTSLENENDNGDEKNQDQAKQQQSPSHSHSQSQSQAQSERIDIPKLKLQKIREEDKLDVTLLAIKHKKIQTLRKKHSMMMERQIPIPTPPPVKKEGRGACCGMNSCNIF